MPGIGHRIRARRKPIPEVTLGPAARAAFRVMNPGRFSGIKHGTVLTLGPGGRAFLRRKGVTIDRWPGKFKVVDRK